ncbi:SHOCT domain-containing protein [Pseudonocardia sp. RS010]|uniref:SHOCT domain-containing protein n=1 Tax=Pseudonocardia sp. RS010 TaxID=3385979 RepID=UPI0039A3CAA7
MPGLLRGIARTAVIAGTASSVAGRVQRRQARRFADRDAETAAERERAYEAQMAPPPPAGGADVITQLKQLGELRDQGVLTDEEFAAQKAKILG